MASYPNSSYNYTHSSYWGMDLRGHFRYVNVRPEIQIYNNVAM